MDITPLLSAPALAIAATLIIVSAWIGYVLGKSNENKRVVLSLTGGTQGSEEDGDAAQQDKQKT